MKVKCEGVIVCAGTYEDPRKLLDRAVTEGKVNSMVFWDYENMPGYYNLGTATIELDLDEQEAVKNVVASLEAQLEEGRKKYLEGQKMIQDRINSLLALPMTPQASDEVDDDIL